MHDGSPSPFAALTWKERIAVLARQATRAHVAWDLAMVYFALANVTLIAFDWTYLWFRPFYVERGPIVAEYYDAVKGIEPVPAAERTVALARDLRIRERGDTAAVEHELADLADVFGRFVSANPYERTGQGKTYLSLIVRLTAYVRGGNPAAASAGPVATARAFWLDAEHDLGARLDYFDTELRPLVMMAYTRGYDRNGEFIDRFWVLDLPFVVLFAGEFTVRWLLSVRRRDYPRWFFYPVIHWYDALGSLPQAELRLLRFLRIFSIYNRLRRGVLSGLSADPLSRAASYVGDVIKEEVSDMVTLRILEETQQEIRSGTHARIVQAVFEPRQAAIVSEVVERLQRTVASTEVREKLREFMQQNLERSIDAAPAFRNIPLPSVVLTPLVRGVGEIVFDSFAETLQATFAEEDGRRIIEELVADAVHGVVSEVTAGELEAMLREVALETIEHMKTAVSRRKWMETQLGAGC